MKKISLYALLISIVFISFYRFSNINPKREIAWDILGYYLPLPASFVYGDPLLTNIQWLKELNDEEHLAGTLYMVSSNDKGEPMFFFFFGMSYFYFPFFLIGHFSAWLGNYPIDGFSPPYQYALVVGAVIYTIIGLLIFRKILLNFFSDKTAALIILTTVFGTNYVHHFTISNLETIPVIFMLVNVVIWYTIKWHEIQKLKYILLISSAIALIALVKPSEIVVGLIPLLWGVDSVASAKAKFAQLLKHRKQLLLATLLGIIIVSPQLLYWLLKTGNILYDSYKNPGVGLDFFSPHIPEVLFSFRKGWLLYTPIMVFYLAGFWFLYKAKRDVFFALFIYFLVSFYIISSWSEWWYGAGFSNRPLIATYPVLAIAFGFLLENLWKKNILFRSSFVAILLVLVLLNQFQWWQFKNYLIDPYRTTKKSYMAVFLKTKTPENFNDLLLVYRDFTGSMVFDNREKYISRTLLYNNFDSLSSKKENIKHDHENAYYCVKSNDEFALSYKIKYRDLTKKYYAWISVRFKYRNFTNIAPFLTITMSRKEGNYAYYSFVPKSNSDSSWAENEFVYMTPEIRNINDELMIYFWNRDKGNFCVDDFEIRVYEEK
jgi:hypothetical protein